MNLKIKILAVVIAVFMAIVFMCSIITVGAANALKINTTGAEGERGDTVKVTLNVESNPGFAALLIKIPETDGIEVVEVKNGTVMRQITVGKNILWDSSSNSKATGTLLTVTLRIGENAKSGEHVINVKVFECFNDKFEAVDVNIEPIVIRVIGDDVKEDTTVPVIDTENKETTDSFEDSEATEGMTEDKTEEKTEEKTEAKTEEKTEVPHESTPDSGKEPSESVEETDWSNNGVVTITYGCNSFAGGAVIFAVIIPVAIALVSKKRK